MVKRGVIFPPQKKKKIVAVPFWRGVEEKWWKN
jgi:hypothetical protein